MTASFHKFESGTLYIMASANGAAQINFNNGGTDAFQVMFTKGYAISNEHTAKAQVTSEITAANYITGGLGLANISVTLDASGTARWDADDVVVTASATSIEADGHVLVAHSAGDRLIAFLSAATANAGDGTTYQITWASDGIFKLV